MTKYLPLINWWNQFARPIEFKSFLMLINEDKFHLNLDSNGTNSTGRSASVFGYRKFSAFAANLKYILGIPMDDPNHQLLIKKW